MNPVRYHVRHDTIYHYDQPVGESHQLLRVTPRDLPWQKCVAHHIEVTPEPTRSQDFVDNFGNVVRTLHFEDDHDELIIRADSWVEIEPRPTPVLAASPRWEVVREQLAYHPDRHLAPANLDATAFLFESSDIRLKRDFAKYAARDFVRRTPLLVAVDGLMRRIHEDFTFDPKATDVSTPVTEVFAKRRGVCQDFAHLMISCLRSTGVAARYVSGYLLTRPPPGRPRLIGADATHAWVSVFCAELGWVDFDPTNAVLPDCEHITIGWGRDFTDVSPLRGVILGGGEHEPGIAVTVVPEDEFTELYSDTDRPVPNLLPDRA
jgi:transglutaminase-like putative cysteine protease